MHWPRSGVRQELLDRRSFAQADRPAHGRDQLGLRVDAQRAQDRGVDLRDAIEAGIVPGPRMSTGGNALLTFPGGESIVLVGVSPAQLSSVSDLEAIGIPPAPDFIVVVNSDKQLAEINIGNEGFFQLCFGFSRITTIE